MQNFNTIMSQCLQLLPRKEFDRFVGQHKANRYTKHFTAWNQLSVMLYAQATTKDSLRDLQIGLQYNASKWNHLGLMSASKSTIADANNRRSYQLFESLFYALLKRCKGFIPEKKFSFKNDLYSVDASTINLCLSVFNWAKFRKRKGAIKIHPLLNHKTQIPEFMTISIGKTHEITETKNVWRQWNLSPESILTFDRGYIDWRWFYELHQEKIYFVSRIKIDTNYFVIKDMNILEKNILADQVIGLGSDRGIKEYPQNIRLVSYYDEEKEKVYQYITNNFELSAHTIADIYKERWQIELFFKWIKQHLKIKTFLGTSQNAVMSQIWIAMIYFLILAYIKAQTKTSLSMLELSRIFSLAFFDRVSIIDLLSLKPASTINIIRGSPLQPVLF